MESQELQMEDFVNMMGDNVRHELQKAISEKGSMWQVLCEKIESGNLETKLNCLQLGEILINGVSHWPGVAILDLVDSLFEIHEIIIEDKIVDKQRNEWLQVATHASSLIASIAGMLQDDVSRISGTKFMEDASPLLFTDWFKSSLAIIVHNNFPKLSSPLARGILEFMRGVCRMLTMYRDEEDMHQLGPILAPEISNFCKCSFFEQQEKIVVLDYLNPIIKIGQSICKSDARNFYSRFGTKVDFDNDIDAAVKILADAVPFDDSALSSMPVLLLNAVCEARGISLRHIFGGYCDRIMIRLIHRLINHVNEVSEDLERLIKNYFENAASLYGYGGVRLVKWLGWNLQYIIPTLMLSPSNASSTIHKMIAKICGTNRQSLIRENISHILVRVALENVDPTGSQIYEFIESEGATIDPKDGKEVRVPFNQYVTYNLFKCVNGLSTSLAAAEERIIDMLAHIRLMVEEDVDQAKDQSHQVVKFVRPRLLGILSKFTGKFITLRCPIDEKLVALRSLIIWTELLAGDVLSEVSSKMISTLRAASATDDSRFRPHIANAWKTLLVKVNVTTMKEVVLAVFVAITPFLSDPEPSIVEILEELLQTIFSTHAQQLADEIADITFLSKDIESPLLRKYCLQFDDNVYPLKDLLGVGLKLLQHEEHPDTKRLALERLKTLLRSRSKDLYKLILELDSVDHIISQLVSTLSSSLCHPDISVRRLAATCMGDLGAVDPGRLRTDPLSSNLFSQRSQIVFADFEDSKSYEFPCALLCEITKLLLGASDNFYDVCSWTLQEILSFYNCRDGGIHRRDTEGGIIWSKLDDLTKKILKPFLSSNFTIDSKSGIPLDQVPVPIFGAPVATTFRDWLTVWMSSLVEQIVVRRAKTLFTDLDKISGSDIGFAQFLIPHIVLQCVTEGKKDVTAKIQHELLAAMSEIPSGGDSVIDANFERCAAHVVFCILDFLYKWTLHVQNTAGATVAQVRLQSVQSFLSRIPKEKASLRASIVESFPRALMYYEDYMDGQPMNEKETVSRDHVNRLQEIYHSLDDVDGVVGALATLKKGGQSVQMERVLALEATGNYTEAQAFWEAASSANRGSEEALNTHVRLVSCFLRLNQANVCERYLTGLSRSSTEWENALHPYRVEALLKLQQWDDLDKELSDHPNAPPSWSTDVGNLLISARSKNVEGFNEKLTVARDHILEKLSVATKEAGNCDGGYNQILRLHMLSDIERGAEELFGGKEIEEVHSLDEMGSEWDQRFKIVQPSIDVQYALLDLRKQVLRLGSPTHKTEKAVGACWLEAAKVARKTGHYQTAWNLLVKAKEFGLVDTFLEEAKLLWSKDEKTEAISCLLMGLQQNYPEMLSLKTAKGVSDERKFSFAKAQLLNANYCRESSSIESNNITRYYEYINKPEIFPNWEDGHYYMGVHFDQILRSTVEPHYKDIQNVLRSYAKSLEFGSRYVHHSMPRLLTLWLDTTHKMFSDCSKSAPPNQATKAVLEQFKSKQLQIEEYIKDSNDIIQDAVARIPTYQLYCCFSQLISRICHPCLSTFQLLKEILANLLATYPHQCLWMAISVKRSSIQERSSRCTEILQLALRKNPGMKAVYSAVDKLSEQLIVVCDRVPPSTTTTEFSLKRDFKELMEFFKNGKQKEVILPLQIFMDVGYPVSTPGCTPDPGHKPFNERPVSISHFLDRVPIFPTMQRPKRLSLIGSDGQQYSIMCKSRDDLRQDKRLMEFTNLVNGCLLRDPEARRRELHIRTYTVTPLSERCGFLEWVPNLDAIRSIYIRLCNEYGHKFFSGRDLQAYSCKLNDSVEKKLKIFKENLLPKHPALFRYWFSRTFPDPMAWYQARLNYTRTAAVMSMVGYIVGLGDRHNENILIDCTCGDVVHVDFACLFNRGEALEYPEIVPFRLTRNMVDGMGPLGVEGHYRKACEVTMKLMRDEASMLRTVLETFIHDPLLEWQRPGGNKHRPEGGEEKAMEHLTNIDQRLQGRVKQPRRGGTYGMPLSVEGQVSTLIHQATDEALLSQMYIGWSAFI